MKSSMTLKIFSIIGVAIGLSFATVIITVFALLMGFRFYLYIVPIIALGLLLFFIAHIFQLFSRKKIKIALTSFLSLCLVITVTFQVREVYYNNIGKVSEQDFNLWEYVPFREESKVITLDEPATLQLEGDLPVLDGATALYPVYAAFAQATYPEKDYPPYDSEVMSNQTGEAYRSLFNGDADIIFAAGPSQGQLNAAERLGVELELTPIGREAFVFFVNARNNVEDISIEEIQGIYSGDITNWSELGGNNHDIRAFQRPADSGSQTALENLMGDIPLMAPPTEDIVSGMGGIITETSSYRNYRNAIGYSFRYFSTEMVQNKQIRHLAVEGVYPDKESIRNGSYPIASEFYAITAGTENPNVAKLIDWILSDQGQYIIEETGYVPLN
ncbi:PstS family phosphate ABC transporter substrate-binding protein [Evansella cellulosilytica]|uniref:PBP domain-containing protein n=1 Tax=Evansella cellulosilytica (strain ATCC 21833 / DSM 2522 / FERM P-1141 / JCM 9156 / N-4) TaxID=649639 RepID=E6TRY5_EVAC2|nr:substrate-binding domain-containing protein [Evansella cellulosilytica]ADU30639.1 hypothetical protein Bcell_2381 [Evansella cellulosilytica DSM 2522]